LTVFDVIIDEKPSFSPLPVKAGRVFFKVNF